MMAPTISMSPTIMSSPPSSSQLSSYPMPPQYPQAPPPSQYSHSPSTVMMGSQTPLLSVLDPPISPVSSSAYSTPLEKVQYEIAPAVPRWDRQEPEYKHIDEPEAVVAPDVVVADMVDEKSTDSKEVEKVHDNERLARMDLKYEEPEPTPFENGTVTFHAWFLRKL